MEQRVGLDTGVLDARLGERRSHAMQLEWIGAAEGDVIESDAKRIERVVGRGVGRGPTHADDSPAGEKEEELFNLEQEREPQPLDVEHLGPREVGRAE